MQAIQNEDKANQLDIGVMGLYLLLSQECRCGSPFKWIICRINSKAVCQTKTYLPRGKIKVTAEGLPVNGLQAEQMQLPGKSFIFVSSNHHVQRGQQKSYMAT